MTYTNKGSNGAMVDKIVAAASSDVASKNLNIIRPNLDANVMSKKIEIVESMEAHASDALSLLRSVEKSWQPIDFLPNFGEEGWVEKVRSIQETCQELPDDVLVALIGDMVTEEALPSYQTMLNRFEGIADATGNDDHAWAKWSRWWTAEENRHGDLLNKFLYLSGRVNMRSVEVSIQNLLRNGFNAMAEQDPYKGFVYTSFQERATRISHNNVAILARKAGNDLLDRICKFIAGDEARHEEAYKRFMDKIFELDPEQAIYSFRDMMKSTIVMPARLMDDESNMDTLFKRFSEVAERIGVYTAHDYADIIDHLIERWKIASLSGLSGEAARAQEYLCKLAARYRSLAERLDAKKERTQVEPQAFNWIHGRTV